MAKNGTNDKKRDANDINDTNDRHLGTLLDTNDTNVTSRINDTIGIIDTTKYYRWQLIDVNMSSCPLFPTLSFFKLVLCGRMHFSVRIFRDQLVRDVTLNVSAHSWSGVHVCRQRKIHLLTHQLCFCVDLKTLKVHTFIIAVSNFFI